MLTALTSSDTSFLVTQQQATYAINSALLTHVNYKSLCNMCFVTFCAVNLLTATRCVCLTCADHLVFVLNIHLALSLHLGLRQNRISDTFPLSRVESVTFLAISFTSHSCISSPHDSTAYRVTVILNSFSPTLGLGISQTHHPITRIFKIAPLT